MLPIERDGWNPVGPNPKDMIRDPDERLMWSTRDVWATRDYKIQVEEAWLNVGDAVHNALPGGRGWLAYQLQQQNPAIALLTFWDMNAIDLALDELDALLDAKLGAYGTPAAEAGTWATNSRP